MADNEKKLYLLDAFALIYRAYYSFIRNPRINSKGFNTSAVFGFTNTLLEVLNKHQPSHIAVVFDSPGQTFREEQFTDYKANREAMPEDIRNSLDYIKDLIRAFNIPIIAQEGFEADDIIGTLARKAEEQGFITYMMTPDKDYGQLVTENTFMLKPGRGGKGPEIWGPKEVCEQFEVENPRQVIDILGLWGDAVDNIPGIPGIGEKTAKKLIGQYGSIEELLKHTDDLKGKQKENVIEYGEQGLLSKELATIILDVPVEFDPKALEIEEPDKEKLKELFSDLEFRTLAKRLLGEEITVAPAAGTQIDMFGHANVTTGNGNGAAEPTAEPTEMKTIDNTEHDYVLVDSDAAITALVADLLKQKSFCFDTETTGVDEHTAELVGMSFSWEDHKGYYVPVPESYDDAVALVARFKGPFESEKIEKVAQNIKYDLTMLTRYGIEFKGPLFDTMIAHYLIQPDMKHGMDVLAETYLGYRPVSIETLIGKKGKNQLSMRDVELDQLTRYAAEDADITWQLKNVFEPSVNEDHLKKLFYEIEMPLTRVLAEMEAEGINLDTKTLGEFSAELGDGIDKLSKQIIKHAGTDFNIDSPRQLGQILYEVLEITDKPKKTKTGQYSTNEDTLSKLASTHEIVPMILDYRSLKKLKSTYVDALPTLVNEKTNRIHTTYMQAVAATGRLSSNNPNLQNIPIRTEKGREIRKAFIPRDKDHVLLAADYSQIELRIVAALSKDENMIHAFKEGLDIHSATAAKVFEVGDGEVTREQRSAAKAVNFGIIYGQSAFGLAQNLNISRKEAKEIIDSYFAQYPNIRDLMNNNIEFAKEHGYVETIMGRRRYLRDINSANAVVRSAAERNAINAPIQGSAADIIKVAMIDIAEGIRKHGFKSRMLLQVHDELVFDTRKDELDEFKQFVVEGMEHAVKIDVPLEVDAESGENWLQAH